MSKRNKVQATGALAVSGIIYKLIAMPTDYKQARECKNAYVWAGYKTFIKRQIGCWGVYSEWKPLNDL